VEEQARRIFAPERLALTVLGPIDVQSIANAFESLAESA
jgi:hypothetical protein